MSELAQHCDRCGSEFLGTATAVKIESGPLLAAHPSLTLCPHCTESMSRWLARRQPRPSVPAAPVQPAAGSEKTALHGGHRRSRRKARNRIKRTLIAVAILSVASLFAMAVGVLFIKWTASP